MTLLLIMLAQADPTVDPYKYQQNYQRWESQQEQEHRDETRRWQSEQGSGDKEDADDRVGADGAGVEGEE